MKNLLLASSVATAMLLSAAAQASTIIPVTFGAPAADGSLAGVFSAVNTGTTFDDLFTFTLPTGMASAGVNSTLTATSNDISFGAVTLNGSAFSNTSTGTNEARFIDFLPVTAGTQTIRVTGTSGGNGSYSGTVNFSPIAGVPEPASWALMILGFGGVGAIVRSRKERRAVAA